MVPIATRVNRPAEMRPTLSPKFSRPTARPPRMTVKFSHERNVPVFIIYFQNFITISLSFRIFSFFFSGIKDIYIMGIWMDNLRKGCFQHTFVGKVNLRFIRISQLMSTRHWGEEDVME